MTVKQCKADNYFVRLSVLLMDCLWFMSHVHGQNNRSKTRRWSKHTFFSISISIIVKVVMKELANPLMLATALSSLAILMKSYRQKRNEESIWRRNVDQYTANSYPPNILQNQC